MVRSQLWFLALTCVLAPLSALAQEAHPADAAADPIVGDWAPLENVDAAAHFGAEGTIGFTVPGEEDDAARCHEAGSGEAADQCAQGRWTAGEGGAYTLEFPILETMMGPDPGQIGCSCNWESMTAQLVGDQLTLQMGNDTMTLQRQPTEPAPPVP